MEILWIDATLPLPSYQEKDQKMVTPHWCRLDIHNGQILVATLTFINIEADGMSTSDTKQTPVSPAPPKQPWAMTSSDGSDGHPRKYGSFPHKYREYVRRRQVMNLSEFIDRSSALRHVSFMEYDLGFFDEDESRVAPADNPFVPKVLPMSSV